MIGHLFLLPAADMASRNFFRRLWSPVGSQHGWSLSSVWSVPGCGVTISQLPVSCTDLRGRYQGSTGDAVSPGCGDMGPSLARVSIRRKLSRQALWHLDLASGECHCGQARADLTESGSQNSLEGSSLDLRGQFFLNFYIRSGKLLGLD